MKCLKIKDEIDQAKETHNETQNDEAYLKNNQTKLL